MSWQAHFEQEVRRRHPAAGEWYARVSKQPSWVTKTALAVALLVVVVPVLALTLAAVIIGLACLVVLSVIARAWAYVNGMFTGQRRPKDDGRRNVTVIDRH